MKRKMKRVVACTLSLVLLAFSLAGCGGSSDTDVPAGKDLPESAAGEQETAGDAGGQSAAADTSEYSKEPVTLTAFVNSVMMPTDWKWGDDPTSQKITELTGVTLDIQYATTTDNMELNTMLASGEKLPDFIITPANGPVRPLLVDQGFVLPYNDLIEQYAPHLGEIMPKNMDKIYTEPDGKFYCTVSFFGDENRYGDQILNSRGSISVSMNKKYYDEIGRPDVSTLDKYTDAVVQMKDKHPEINNPIYDYAPTTPWSHNSMLNLLARMYGATNDHFEYSNGKVEMTFMQPYYKEALRTYNEWYRKGLINPEQWAFKNDQKKAAYADQDMLSYWGYYWALLQGTGKVNELNFETIEYPMPDGRSADQLKIHDDYYSTGYQGVFITKDTEHPDRCIQYIDFLMGDEGQILQRYGTEGLTWEPDEHGRPKETELKIKTEAESMEKLQRELGVYNYNFAWLTSNWAIVYGAHNTYSAYPGMLKDFEVMTPHQQNEMLSDLTYALTNTDELALREQIYSTWASGTAAVCVAETEADFETAYDKLISDMKHSGVDTLCEYFQANYDHWVSLGIGQ